MYTAVKKYALTLLKILAQTSIYHWFEYNIKNSFLAIFGVNNERD